MVTRKKQKGLGRGLDALLGSDSNALDNINPARLTGANQTMSTDKLQAGKYQPRTRMDDAAISALAESIRQQGVMQPILVRAIPGPDARYEVIAGERRLRAAIKAGLKEVPVIEKDVNDEQAAIMALIENIQREDLNPMEEARGIKRMLDEFALTHDQIAAAIGRSRSATSNLLRLVNLTQPVQDLLMNGAIDMGHARALLALPAAEQIQAANRIVAKRLSVREAEQLVNKGLAQDKNKSANAKVVNQDIERMQNRLSDQFGTKVAIKASTKGAGQLSLSFHSWDEFEGLLQQMGLNDFLKEA